MLPTDFAILSAPSSASRCASRSARAAARAPPASAPPRSRGAGRSGRCRRRGSRTARRASPRPSRSTRCASPAGRAPRARPRPCPPSASAPSRARSRAGPPCSAAPSHALALVHLVDVAVRELAVLRQRAHAEVDVALDRVRVPALDQVADQRDDLLDHQRRLRLVVGAAEPEPLRVGDVVRGHLRRELVRRPSGGPRRVVDLVVDVGDVGDERRLVALVREEAGQQAEDDERARVADVDARRTRSARRRRCRPCARRAGAAPSAHRSRCRAGGPCASGGAPYPSTDVAWWGQPTGLDSGEPRWRR